MNKHAASDAANKNVDLARLAELPSLVPVRGLPRVETGSRRCCGWMLEPSTMPIVIRQAGTRNFVDKEGVLARLLDVMLIPLGAALASHFFMPDSGHLIVEGAFVAFDMALGILLLPLFGV